MVLKIGRRGLVAVSPAAALLPANAWAAGGGSDPRNSAEGQIKLIAALDGAPAFWIYHGIIYAVRPAAHPLPLLAITGCNTVWAEKLAGGAWRVTGSLLTFFRDPDTGAFLDNFNNPITGARCAVEPNYLHGGSTLYPADGGSAIAEGQIAASVIAPNGFKSSDPTKKLGAVRWSVLANTVLLNTDRSWNVSAQPQLEAQTQFGDASSFFNPDIRRMAASVATTTITPWITWLGMAGTAGELVWHVSGEKLFDTDAIPSDYRSRAGARMQSLLTRP